MGVARLDPSCALSGAHFGRQTMRNSDNRILTSHVGSLPRPDELIEANRAREAGERDRRGRVSSRRCARSVADVVRRQHDARHRRCRRRRIRQVDGPPGQLRRLVELCVPALGGLELGAPGHVRPDAAALAPGRDRADQLRRPARPATLRRRLRRPRIRRVDGAAARNGAGLRRRRSPIPAMPRSRPTSPTSRRRSPRPGSRRAS